MCDTHTHTHTHTHSRTCHLFVSTFIYFPYFFLHSLREKNGEIHTLTEICVCCVPWARVGDIFFSRGKSNPMAAVSLYVGLSFLYHDIN